MGGNVRFGARIDAIRPTAGGDNFQVCIGQNENAETIPARAVVLATPAYVASHLMAPVSQSLSHTLSGIAYAGVAVAAAGYFANQIGVPIEGFGVLVPRSEKLRTLGTVFNSSLFPHRAREGSAVITSFVGGATDSEIIEKPEDEIAAIVQADNAKILQITGSPVASAVWKHPKALPQYNLGHHHIVQSIRDGELKNSGLFFSGNYLAGPSLGKCIEHGFKTADAVRDFLQRPVPSDGS
jgi:oxygen-dependent protoporphyrinogen oxidase